MSRGFAIIDTLSSDHAESLDRLRRELGALGVNENDRSAVRAALTVIAHPPKDDVLCRAADAVRETRRRWQCYLQGDRRGKKTMALDYEIARAVAKVLDG
jgi:hypothetical protein